VFDFPMRLLDFRKYGVQKSNENFWKAENNFKKE
jgi:hypothetical protein